VRKYIYITTHTTTHPPC